ncbi:MAG: Gfo/Idh/MocA family oxidoreductase [Gemmatimonadaceae bacterium]
MRSTVPLGAMIIGAGLMGRWHADAVARSGNRVLAVVDPDLARGTILARRVGTRVVAQSVEELPAKLHIDVAHVCTPLATHDAIARVVVSRGCHALVEKPLARTAAETAALLQLGAATNRMIVPVHQFLFQAGVLDVAEIVRADRGSLLHLDIVACTAGAVDRDGAGRDEIALSILPHGLGIARRLADTSVGDANWTVLRASSGEIRCVTNLGGVTVSLLVSTSGRPPVNMLQVVMRDRTVAVDLFHGYSISIRGGTGRAYKLLRPFSVSTRTALAAAKNGARRAMHREMAYPGLRELVSRFYTAAATGGAPPISAEETLDVATARDRIEIGALGAASGISG